MEPAKFARTGTFPIRSESTSVHGDEPLDTDNESTSDSSDSEIENVNPENEQEPETRYPRRAFRIIL